ncbi:hypothetical protein ACFO5R_16470 [Halosolutus amylolyticus]|uniref:Uncharacterized protein n=1 Tax=Halosolutus amylolyticus TaxID=2932267 RepID=A0ABD5PSG3_9EURY|nr:hypothetical protein [Halosolutus amylolyticus]
MKLDRRNLLELAGASAVATMGGMAGCLDTVGLGDDDGSGTPAYAQWVSWDDDADGTFYAYVDWKALSEFDDLESEPDLNESFGDEGDGDGDLDDFGYDDPMLALPSVSILLVALGGGFGLMGTGLSGILTPADETDDEEETDDETEFGTGETADASDFETDVDVFLMVNDAFVLAGDVDTDEIDETLTEPPESEWGFKTEYEQTEEISGFSVYEPAGADEDDTSFGMEQDDAIAVSDDAIVFTAGSDDAEAIEKIRGPIEAASGDGTRAADENDDFAWLLETAGHGHVAFGGYGDLEDDEGNETQDEMDVDPDEADELEELDDAVGVVASLTIEGESESTGRLAAVFEELDDDAEATIEDELGASAEEVSHDVEGDRVTVSATWTEDVLSEEP